MNLTTITLSDMQVLAIAKDFAKTIHARVVNMHLRVTWGILPGDTGECPYVPFPGDEDNFKDMQAALRSVTDPDARRMLVRHIRHYFHEMRDERGKPILKWQDYVEMVKVNAAQMRYQAAKEKTELASLGIVPRIYDNDFEVKPEVPA
jgi:hypothetical protein